MAIASAGLILFLIGHLAGNLLVFAGPEAMNAYARSLRSFPLLLWGARLGLIAIFSLHVILGIKLYMENRRARPTKYRYSNTVQATLASRSMMISGLVLLTYLVYHLLHFTFGQVHSDYFHLEDNLGRHDVYSMVVFSFQQLPIVIAYLISMLSVALHLSHGLPSLMQSLGWNSPRFEAAFRRTGLLFAILIFAGYSSIPLAVYFGLLRLP